MKVAIAAAGRFHAIRLAQELEKRSALTVLFSASVTDRDYDYLQKKHVIMMYSCALIDCWYARLRLNYLIRPTVVNSWKDALFGCLVSRNLKDYSDLDIFTGWAHYCYESLDLIKKARYFILESGSAHIAYQDKLLREEYAQAGQSYALISQAQKERMIREYDAADVIMTPSLFVKNSFITQGYSPDKIATIWCGADLSFFSMSTQDFQSLTLDRSTRKTVTILFVGLVCLRKGIRLLLQAWRLLRKEYRHIRLQLAGALMPDARALIKNFSHDFSVEYMGPVTRERLRELYKGADIFVLPSIEEGFGMVVGEAMAMGLPVVVSDQVGASDLLLAGEDGFIFSSGRADQLASILALLINNQELRLQVGHKALEKSSLLSWERYGDETISFYKKLLNKKLLEGP